MIEKFTRKEACELSGLTGKQVDYLSEKCVIVPEKIGAPTRPTVLYTFYQVIQLKIVASLRERNVSNSCIYGFLKFFEDNNKDVVRYKKFLINSFSKIKLAETKNESELMEKLPPDSEERQKYLNSDQHIFVIEEASLGKPLKFFILTPIELKEWVNDLVQKTPSSKLIFATVSDIVPEIKQAAKKYKVLNFDKKATQSEVA